MLSRKPRTEILVINPWHTNQTSPYCFLQTVGMLPLPCLLFSVYLQQCLCICRLHFCTRLLTATTWVEWCSTMIRDHVCYHGNRLRENHKGAIFLFLPSYCGVQRSEEQKRAFIFVYSLLKSLFILFSFSFFYDNVSVIICHGGNVVSSVPSSQNLEQHWMTACSFCSLSACTSRPNSTYCYLQYWVLLLCVDIWLIFVSSFIIWCS